MPTIFADTGYWQAVVDARDDLHDRAVELSSQLAGHTVVTSELVFVELLNAVSAFGGSVRAETVSLLRSLKEDRDVRVVPMTTAQFQSALTLYERSHARKNGASWTVPLSSS